MAATRRALVFLAAQLAAAAVAKPGLTKEPPHDRTAESLEPLGDCSGDDGKPGCPGRLRALLTLKEGKKGENVAPKALNRKLRIAIHMNNDPEFVVSFEKERGKLIISEWECYCLLHGYTCIFEPARVGYLGANGHLSRYRMRSVLKYLPLYDYVIQVALDTVVVNRSFAFEQWLDGSPDVVASLRSNMWGGQHPPLTSLFPKEKFPERPEVVVFPPLLHTEVIMIKNSPQGAEFCEDMLRHADIVPDGAVDMTAMQHAALRFVWPVTDKVSNLLEFALNMSTLNVPGYIHGGYLGYNGPWFRQNYSAVAVAYFDLTTKVIAEQRDWHHESKGHLRVLQEAEVVRDWYPGKLMRSGDFIVHTKNFFNDEGHLNPEDSECRPAEVDLPQSDTFVAINGQRFQAALRTELFADDEESRAIALSYRYDQDRIFHKVSGVSFR